MCAGLWGLDGAGLGGCRLGGLVDYSLSGEGDAAAEADAEKGDADSTTPQKALRPAAEDAYHDAVACLGEPVFDLSSLPRHLDHNLHTLVPDLVLDVAITQDAERRVLRFLTSQKLRPSSLFSRGAARPETRVQHSARGP